MENDERIPAEIEGETEKEQLTRFARFVSEGTKAEYEKVRTRYIAKWPQTSSTLLPWDELSDEVQAILLICLNQDKE